MNFATRLILGHLLDCKEATRLVSQLNERPATAVERTRLRWHLAACAACARFERQIRILRQAMRQYRT